MPFSEKFQKALEFVLNNEGGFIDNAFDHGGPTNCGITLDTLSKFKGKPVSSLDIKEITREEVEEIYCALFWEPLGLDNISDQNLCSMFFDQAVNRGISAVVHQIQEIIRVRIDGFMGPVTIDTINSVPSNRLAIDFFKSSQLAYGQIVKRNPNQVVFLLGWLSRTHRLLGLIKLA